MFENAGRIRVPRTEKKRVISVQTLVNFQTDLNLTLNEHLAQFSSTPALFTARIESGRKTRANVVDQTLFTHTLGT